MWRSPSVARRTASTVPVTWTQAARTTSRDGWYTYLSWSVGVQAVGCVGVSGPADGEARAGVARAVAPGGSGPCARIVPTTAITTNPKARTAKTSRLDGDGGFKRFRPVCNSRRRASGRWGDRLARGYSTGSHRNPVSARPLPCRRSYERALGDGVPILVEPFD